MMFVLELSTLAPTSDDITLHPDCHNSRIIFIRREASPQMSSEEDDDEKLVTKPFKFVTGEQTPLGLNASQS